MTESILVLILAFASFGKAVNGCSCTSQTEVDHTGKTIGRCLTSFKGNYWCYVSSSSSCPDKKQSSRNQLYWSAQACLNEGGKETPGSGNVGQDNAQPLRVVSGSRGVKLPTCTTVDGVACAFPFKFNGKGYRGCTLDKADDGVPWCSTKVDQNGNHVKGNFGGCSAGCPNDPGYFIGSRDYQNLGGSNSSTRGPSGSAMVDMYSFDTAQSRYFDQWPQYPCKMYENCGYGGLALIGSPGSSAASLETYGFSDKGSSFRVRPGCKLEVWEHDNYEGRTSYVDSNIKCAGGGWNNIVSSLKCTCGSPTASQRPPCGRSNECEISGGTVTCPNQYPWMVRLSGCGGALITDKHVLTAKHCLDGRINWRGRSVKVGVHNQNDPSDYQEVTIQDYVWPDIQDSDIAIIILETSVNLNDRTIGTVCLPSSASKDYRGERTMAMGWGMTHVGSSQSALLQHVPLTVTQRQHQNWLYTDVPVVNGVPLDPCAGDSGGPLVHQDTLSGRWTIIGTVWGGGYDCRSGTTRGDGKWNSVTDHLDWIKSIIS